MRAKHVLFDFDGVLCDSLAACVDEYERLRRERYSPLPPLNDADRMDVVFAGALKTSLHRWLSPTEGSAFFDDHSAAMAASATRLRPFTGVREMLASMPPRSASIVSSAYNDAIRHVLGDVDGTLPESIAFLMGRDMRQPKDVKIRSVLDALALDADEAIYVGDLESDYLYCKTVPVPIILVGYGYHSADYLRRVAPDAVAVVDSVAALAAQLRAYLKASRLPHGT
jgi:phosphoglycolate phosphatase-like HAD superfamily hydrolase